MYFLPPSQATQVRMMHAFPSTLHFPPTHHFTLHSCLITAVTSPVQAVAAAEAGVGYVAPYVGRVSDWHKANPSGSPSNSGSTTTTAMTGSGGVDMGVQLVWDIQRYYHSHGYKTKVGEMRT